MHWFPHNPDLVAAVVGVSTAAYGRRRPVSEVTVESLTAEVPGVAADLLQDAIDALDRVGLLRRRAEGRLSLNATGKRAQEEACVPELVFGDPFIIEKYSPAVVHVIIRTRTGEEHGGTGFIIAHPEPVIVTAKHVLENNELLRIERRDGSLACGAATQILPGPQGVDLAAIRANFPENIVPMRIELRDQKAVDLEPVVVLGYPPIAGHGPALIPVNAQATGGVPTYDGQRRSLVLQRMTTPGFSGAPVLDRRGIVIGVVREEAAVDRGNGPGVFILGTPAHYFRDVLG